MALHSHSNLANWSRVFDPFFSRNVGKWWVLFGGDGFTSAAPAVVNDFGDLVQVR